MFFSKSTVIVFVLFIIFSKLKLYENFMIPIVIPAAKTTLKLIIKLFRVLLKEVRRRTDILKNTKVIEYLSNNEDIVLVGDNILENSKYVPKNKSVKDEIFKKHENMLMFAENDTKIRDVEKQIKKMPKHLNKKSTHLIISVGGNDILEEYEKKKASEITTKKIDELFIKYRTLLENIKKNYKMKIVLVNIYLPVAESHVKLHKVIREWNRRQKSYARAKRMKILAIADKFDEPKHFTKKFEPSAEGSKIIAEQVLDI